MTAAVPPPSRWSFRPSALPTFRPPPSRFAHRHRRISALLSSRASRQHVCPMPGTGVSDPLGGGALPARQMGRLEAPAGSARAGVTDSAAGRLPPVASTGSAVCLRAAALFLLGRKDGRTEGRKDVTTERQKDGRTSTGNAAPRTSTRCDRGRPPLSRERRAQAGGRGSRRERQHEPSPSTQPRYVQRSAAATGGSLVPPPEPCTATPAYPSTPSTSSKNAYLKATSRKKSHRPDAPPCPAPMLVLSTSRFSSVFTARSRAVNLAGSQ